MGVTRPGYLGCENETSFPIALLSMHMIAKLLCLRESSLKLVGAIRSLIISHVAEVLPIDGVERLLERDCSVSLCSFQIVCETNKIWVVFMTLYDIALIEQRNMIGMDGQGRRQ